MTDDRMGPATSPHRSIALMFVSVVLFAANVLVIRGLSSHLPAADGWVATLFRGVTGMLLVALVFTRRGLDYHHLLTRRLVILRGLLGGVSILAFYITVVHLGAARAVVINLSYPIFGSLIATVWLREKLAARAWIWMCAGFIGLMVFLGGDLHGRIGRYDLLALAGAIGAGGVIVIIRQLRHTEHTATIYASQCLYSILFTAIPATGATLALPYTGILVLAAASAIVAVAQIAMTHAYRELSVARGSSIQMLLPVLTAIGGYLLFGERFTPAEIGGGVLTLIATLQVVRAPRLKSA